MRFEVLKDRGGSVNLLKNSGIHIQSFPANTEPVCRANNEEITLHGISDATDGADSECHPLNGWHSDLSSKKFRTSGLQANHHQPDLPESLSVLVCAPFRA